MSAPKRTRPLKTVWLQPRAQPDPLASFKRKVLDYAGAKKDLQTLTAAGLDERLLWRHLWGLAWLAKNDTKQDIPWHALPGLPLHTLRRFPGKVRSWADDIERKETTVHSHQLYSGVVQYLPIFLAEALPNTQYEVHVGGKVLRGVGTAKRTIPVALAQRILQKHGELPKLAELPKLLRLYADYIEALYKVTAFYGSKGGKLLGRNMPHELVRFVETYTGKPHWPEVTTLLNASYQAIGCDVEADSKALGMQRTRSKK